MIHSSTDFPEDDPFDRKKGFRWGSHDRNDSSGDEGDVCDGCIADGPNF
jgi:hypothetical protein